MRPYLLHIIVILLIISSVGAEEKYSFEKTEELTPLINWRDFGPDAFDEAVKENKPIFLLLTAPSWCYWCQVYESEDYLFHSEMVAYINANTIPIYVDADQRQDLTRQYLEGGWPSTTVLTPGRNRIYGYSGPRPVDNMLANLRNAVAHVKQNKDYSEVVYNYKPQPQVIPNNAQLRNLLDSYARYTLQVYDSKNGGFGNGQKFPQGRSLDFALEQYEETKDEKWLELVQNTLRNQYTKIEEISSNYNLFDPVEGGFHRYGTTVTWTPPHYEKMLYDNARLLKAYYHLTLVVDDPLPKEVVEKTISFIETNWYDSKGGFFGNSDVHGEDAYYGKFPRPEEKARVEQTKYSNWNAEAIITFLYISEFDSKYMKMAETSLDFFEREMITDNGAFHFEKNGLKEVRGNLLDNSYLLLAFVDGFEKTGKQTYLKTAEKLADFSLNNLYDWHSGGFFERNSPDIELYAPGEHIRLVKPIEENGIMAYALLRLYKHTDNIFYLNAGIKTMGNSMNNLGGLDRGYYAIQAASYIVENNLIAELSPDEKITAKEQQNFWADNLDFSEQVEKTNISLLLIIIALMAGILSFVSPCTLPIIPAFIAYSFKASRKNIVGMTISFFLGLSLLFTILGLSASFIGNFISSNIILFSQISGVIVLLFGLYILFGGGFAGLRIKQSKPTSYLGSFLFGMAIAISWTPCVGPILVALLVLASSETMVVGGLLLFVYSIGFAAPLVLVAFYLKRKSKIWKFMHGKELNIYGWKIHSTSLISGLLFIMLGLLMFSGQLYLFNQYFGATDFQRVIFQIEEFFLGLV